MPNERRKAGLTTPDLIILGFLKEQPMYGYQINLALKERQVEDWAGVSRPQVYYSLKKLEAIGLVTGRSDGSNPAGPERRIFSLTKEAHAALADALEAETWATGRSVPPFFTWAMLSVHANKPAVARIIVRRRNFLHNEIIKERETLESIDADESESSRTAKTLISLVIQGFELELSWLDGFEKATNSRP